MAATCRSLAAIGGVLPKLVDAYRTGDGVAVEAAEAIEAQGDFNRPWLVGSFATEYLPQVPDVHAKLQAGARVADVACGVGWAAIAIARAYPATTVDGFDLDAPSIERARVNAGDAGVADRVTFEARDAADPSLDGQYDLAVIVEAVHDMSHPVEVLATIRRLLAPGGTLIVADESVADAFHAPANETERLFYGYSVLDCLPAGMVDQPSAETGTVMRRSTLRALRVGGGVLAGVGAADRARLPAVLPAGSLGGQRPSWTSSTSTPPNALGWTNAIVVPREPGRGVLVHERNARGPQRLERGGDVVDAVRDVVDPRAARGQEAPDRRLRAQGAQQLDVGLAAAEQDLLDALRLDALAMDRLGAQQVRVRAATAASRSLDGDADVVDRGRRGFRGGRRHPRSPAAPAPARRTARAGAG